MLHPILTLALAAGSAAQDGAAPLFAARPLTAGGEVVTTTCGGDAKDYILEVNGGGLVVADFDLDGHLDLVVIDGSTLERVREGEPALPSRLLLGDGRGGFRPAGEAWRIPPGVWANGGCAGDVDADGDPDLFLTEWGRNRLLLNDGGRGFVDATAGLPAAEGEAPRPTGLDGRRWSTSAAFLDHDGDGNLDLVVVNYLAFHLDEVRGPGDGCSWKGHDVMCGPEGMVPVHDQLYRGAGDGSFTDVSVAAGFRPETAGFGLGVMTLDYDDDGDTDIYVSNDSTPNHLWENQGDGTFVEVGLRRGVSHDSNGKEQAGMGIACGDVDGDGRGDLFVTNFSGERNAFYRSSRGKGFRERADVARLGGPSIQRLGWGTGLHDLDLDGRLDLFVINGHVYPQADRAGTDTSYAQPDQLFLGGAEGRFEERPLADEEPFVGRAAVAADFDEDGDLDLVVIAMNGPVRYLENLAAGVPGRHWLELDLVATGSHPDAVGARVSAVTEDGARSAEVRTTAGYQAGAPRRLHLGLGAAEVVRELRVRWPSGREEVRRDVAVDRVLRLVEGEE
jgi:hypothetical protein